MLESWFDDIGLDFLGDGTSCGSFTGDAGFGEDGVIDEITLKVGARDANGVWSLVERKLDPNNPLFKPLAQAIEFECSDRIAEAVQEWRADAPARAADQKNNEAWEFA